MKEFLFNLPPAHLIYNIQRDSQFNSNIYIPPLQLGEINSMPIFKQQQAPVSTSCYTWAAPWGLQGFLGTARDFLSHRDQCLPAWVVFKHLGSQTLSAEYVQAAAGCMMHVHGYWKQHWEREATPSTCILQSSALTPTIRLHFWIFLLALSQRHMEEKNTTIMRISCKI